jgi:hypothetical protein
MAQPNIQKGSTDFRSAGVKATPPLVASSRREK